MVGVCGKFYTLLPYYRPKYENFPPRILPKSLLIEKKKKKKNLTYLIRDTGY